MKISKGGQKGIMKYLTIESNCICLLSVPFFIHQIIEVI